MNKLFLFNMYVLGFLQSRLSYEASINFENLKKLGTFVFESVCYFKGNKTTQRIPTFTTAHVPVEISR